MKKLTLSTKKDPPEWAILEREIISQLNEVAPIFVKKYTNVDGTLNWKTEFGGMDGSDDPYEAFHNLALLYAIGGSEEVYELARKMFDALTFQWTEYGQIHREFDGYYDWMHHGEGKLFLYFLGLTKPESLVDRQRSERFAKMYTGDDPLAPNYDKERKLIKSPLTGSRGPRYTVTEEDWYECHTVLDEYLAPYEDIPGVDFESMTCKWSDPVIYKRIIELMNQRMNRGDVPLNLNATTLVTHAYLYSHNIAQRNWVLDYLNAWAERAVRNGGIMPDNVGLNDVIGEYNDGKWWGGYYGWRWPHGFPNIIEPLLNATMNAVLITSDFSYLEIVRRQFDINWELRKMKDGKALLPNRYFDKGWSDYREANPRNLIYLWSCSLDDQDFERINAIPQKDYWNEIIIPGKNGHSTLAYKHFIANTISWFQFIQGRHNDYPVAILKADIELIDLHIKMMNSKSGDPKNWDSYSSEDTDEIVGIDLRKPGYQIHAWQWFNPIYFEGLLQLISGSPMHISHGGFQFMNIRPFDGDKKRPGLPEDVSLLVDKISQNAASVEVVNIGQECRNLILQAGGFGEHLFVSVEIDGNSTEIHDKHISLVLDPGVVSRLNFKVERFVNNPSYETPWSHREDWQPLIKSRSAENFGDQYTSIV